MRKTMLVIGAALVSAGLVAGAARAANPDFCHHYADQAVWQFHRNMEIPGCFHGANNQWNGNWEGHFNWCLGAPWEAAREQDSYRGHRLHECMFRAYGHW